MSTTYVIVPLNSDCATWLDEEGVAHPQTSAEHRGPTLADVERVLTELEGYGYSIRRCAATNAWIVDIQSAANPSTGPWTELVLSDNVPAFSFSGGWLQPIFLVLERLSRLCGPLAIADGADATPYLVTPGLAIDSMLEGYELRRTRSCT